MALTKPTAVPNWASTSTNVVVPPNTKRNEGWLFQEKPPSSFENWRARTVGEWLGWVDERFTDYTTGIHSGLSVTNPDDPAESIFHLVRRVIGSSPAHSIIAPGTSPLEINAYTNSNVLDFIMNGVTEARLNGVNSYLSVGAAADSIQIYGKTGIKAFVYGGTAFKQLRWFDPGNEFSFYCDEPIPSFYIRKTEAYGPVIRANQFKFSDDTYFQLESTRIDWILDGTTDAVRYYKGSNTMEFEFNGTIPLNIEPGLIYQGDATKLGNLTNPWEEMTAKVYSLDYDTTIIQGPNHQTDRVANNSITLVAHMDNGVLGPNSYEIDTAVQIGVGRYRFTASHSVGVSPNIFVTCWGSDNVGSATPTAFGDFDVETYRISTGALESSDFSVMKVGRF